jgi:hypothetical protein
VPDAQQKSRWPWCRLARIQLVSVSLSFTFSRADLIHLPYQNVSLLQSQLSRRKLSSKLFERPTVLALSVSISPVRRFTQSTKRFTARSASCGSSRKCKSLTPWQEASKSRSWERESHEYLNPPLKTWMPPTFRYSIFINKFVTQERYDSERVAYCNRSTNCSWSGSWRRSLLRVR